MPASVGTRYPQVINSRWQAEARHVSDGDRCLSMKRIFDVVSSLIGLLLIWPLLVVLGIWVKLDSAGPSKYVANLALKAAQSWKFKAPRVDGRDASSEWLLRFAFSHSRTVVVPLQKDR